MEKLNQSTSRKSFLRWGAIVLSTGFLYNLFSKKKVVEKNENETVKMLTEDGRLVEVEKRYLTENRSRISNDEIHDWVKK